MIWYQCIDFFICSYAEVSAFVNSYHFEVQHSLSDDGQSDRIQYTHVMCRGKTTEKHYGQSLSL